MIPSATPTPFSIKYDIPLDDPIRPTKPVLAYPTLKPTQITEEQLPPLPDLFVTDMEVTQGMQDLDNRMPLVGDRRTVVRVYMGTDGGNLAGVKGMLVAYINGNQAGQPIFADNQSIIAKEDGGSRLNLEDSLYFYVPANWRQKNTTVTFKVFVYAHNTNTPFTLESDADNNFFEVTVDFDSSTTQFLKLVTMHNHAYHDGGATKHVITDYYYNDWDTPKITNDLYRHLPLADLNVVAEGYVVPFGSINLNPIKINLPNSPGDHGTHQNDWNLYPFAAGDSNRNFVSELYLFSIYRMLTVEGIDVFRWYGMIDPELPISALIPDPDDELTPEEEQISFGGAALYGVMIGKMDSTPWVNTPWQISGGITLAHEYTHALGFNHYLCAGNEEDGGAIEPYPYTSPCSLAAVDPEGYYGFDVYYDMWDHLTEPTVISNDPTAATPNLGFPVMGYQAPWWMDAYTWCRILNQWGVSCDPPSIGIAALPQDHLASLDPSLAHAADPAPAQHVGEHGIVVTGLLDRINLNAGFSMVYFTDDAERLEALGGGHDHGDQATAEGFNLVLVNEAGDVLYRVELNHYDLGLHDPFVPAQIPFIEILPQDDAAVAVQLRSFDVVLAEHTFSLNAPEVTVLSPNGGEQFENSVEVSWTASDADGDPLSYTVRYSPDGGSSWYVLGMGITGNEAILDLQPGTPGGDNVLVQVLAHDGTHQGADQSDAPFSLPDQAPQAYIQSPGNNNVYPTNGEVRLQGHGYDPEDGEFAAEDLHWASSVDGELGSGRELELRSLSPGEHDILLSVTDSAGQTHTAAVAIFIDPSQVLPVPDQAEIDAADAILNGIYPEVQQEPTDVPEATAAPATDDGPAETQFRMAGWMIALAVALLALAGYLVYRQRQR